MKLSTSSMRVVVWTMLSNNEIIYEYVFKFEFEFLIFMLTTSIKLTPLRGMSWLIYLVVWCACYSSPLFFNLVCFFGIFLILISNLTLSFNIVFNVLSKASTLDTFTKHVKQNFLHFTSLLFDM